MARISEAAVGWKHLRLLAGAARGSDFERRCATATWAEVSGLTDAIFSRKCLTLPFMSRILTSLKDGLFVSL